MDLVSLQSEASGMERPPLHLQKQVRHLRIAGLRAVPCNLIERGGFGELIDLDELMDEIVGPELELPELHEEILKPSKSKRVPSTFEAVLVRSGDGKPLGIKLDCEGEIAHVCNVATKKGAAVAEYNASVPEECKIAVGDYFVSVNGYTRDTVRPPAKFADVVLQQMVEAKRLIVEVSHPHLYEVHLRKSKSWGLRLAYSNNGSSLVIGGLDAGEGSMLCQCTEVELGDRIVAVGSTRGSATSLLAALRSAQKKQRENSLVTLTMSRPACSHMEMTGLSLRIGLSNCQAGLSAGLGLWKV